MGTTNPLVDTLDKVKDRTGHTVPACRHPQGQGYERAEDDLILYHGVPVRSRPPASPAAPPSVPKKTYS